MSYDISPSLSSMSSLISINKYWIYKFPESLRLETNKQTLKGKEWCIPGTYHSRKNDLVNHKIASTKSEGQTSWNKMELFEWINKGRSEKYTAICVAPSNPHLSAHAEMLYWSRVAKMSKTKTQPLQYFGGEVCSSAFGCTFELSGVTLSVNTQVLSLPPEKLNQNLWEQGPPQHQ